MNSKLLALVLCLLACAAISNSVEIPEKFQIFKDEFNDKVAFVTGGTSGIGYAVTLALAQNGAKVVFIARDSHPNWFNGASVEAKINSDPLVKQSKGAAKFYKADMLNNT